MESECPEAIFDDEMDLEGWNMFEKDDENPKEDDLSLFVRKICTKYCFQTHFINLVYLLGCSGE